MRPLLLKSRIRSTPSSPEALLRTGSTWSPLPRRPAHLKIKIKRHECGFMLEARESRISGRGREGEKKSHGASRGKPSPRSPGRTRPAGWWRRRRTRTRTAPTATAASGPRTRRRPRTAPRVLPWSRSFPPRRSLLASPMLPCGGVERPLLSRSARRGGSCAERAGAPLLRVVGGWSPQQCREKFGRGRGRWGETGAAHGRRAAPMRRSAPPRR